MQGRDLISALKILEELFIELIPQGAGKPFEYSQSSMLRVFLVMTVKKIKNFQSIWNYLSNNKYVRMSCGIKDKLPCSRTLERRFATFSP